MAKKSEISAGDLLDELNSGEDTLPEDIQKTTEEAEVKAKQQREQAEKAFSESLLQRNIVWLPEISRRDIAVGGGKGANLAEMYNLKLPVPPAFIVTATAYQKFIESTGLKNRILSILQETNVDNTEQLESNAKKIREIIESVEMPKNLASEIREAYENLEINRDIIEKATSNVLSILKTGREPVFVAVRSSATTEDLATASFAGQQETFLNIKGIAKLTEAVKRCWASLFTARAIYYREKKGFPHEKSFIAVIVQKMINAEKAGVTFTINPSTNNAEEIVIEAAFGLGEGVVSGTVAPDYYVIDKKTSKLLSKRVSYKNVYFTRSSSGETIKKPLGPDKATEQVLEMHDLVRLANYARELEDHYKVPQDIEWGIEGGRIYILQTRPVTTHEKPISQETVSGEVILEGLPASPGLAGGVVKIIVDLSELSKIQSGDVLVTKMTNPDMVVTMQKASAIVTDEGGMTAHAAIVSREIGIPCVVGTAKATTALKEGEYVTVDGRTGKIYRGKTSAGTAPVQAQTQETSIPEPLHVETLVPGSEEVDEFSSAAEALLLSSMKKSRSKEQEQDINLPKEGKAAELPPTAMETQIEEISASTPHETSAKAETVTKIYMNLGQPDLIDKLKAKDFDGIGLMRVEFMIASKIKRHPLYMIEAGQSNEYVEKLSEGISKVAQAIAPRPVVVRFSDFKSNEYKGLEGGAEYEAEESNPMLGFRGVSRYISEQFEDAFRLECKAIRKSREKNKNIWVMLPFVRKTSEVGKCLEIMESEGLQKSDDFKIWLMAEVPSMALMPEEFAKLDIDGASIGSNDLTQFVLGVDRDSATLGKMGYFDERDRAVLVAINNIIKGFKKHGKTVSICGQAPSVYPELVEFLVKQGIDSISVNPDAVNSVRKSVAEIEKKLLLDAARKNNHPEI